ncbi:hypothetical protein [Microcoleus sp. herbarium12]|uniref:hypothetical protein n=1 Tax=Microcoleus sp. herbarium12 TaxID=3055437 RepID=UPI002FD77D63
MDIALENRLYRKLISLVLEGKGDRTLGKIRAIALRKYSPKCALAKSVTATTLLNLLLFMNNPTN